MDMEAAEWVSRVLANNSMVEIDPMTIAEQITAERMENGNSSSPVASITSSAESPEYFPPSGGGFPKIPYNVAVAAGQICFLLTNQGSVHHFYLQSVLTSLDTCLPIEHISLSTFFQPKLCL